MALARDPRGVLDLFAGPGGWDVAARGLDLDPLGVEYDPTACETREAYGLRTLRADVSTLDPAAFAWAWLLLASPPCQAWSNAGKRLGEVDRHLVYELARAYAGGGRGIEAEWADERSPLAAEPMRWAYALRPEFMAWEQVPPVIELWRLCAELLSGLGYSTWTGIVSAERYGVPQTRKRAILLASRDGHVHPPLPTHQEYRSGEAQWEHPQATLEGELLPWVSMAEALGWGASASPAPTVSGGGTGSGGGVEVFAGREARERAAGHVLRTGMNTMKHSRDAQDMVPYERPVTEPAPTLDAKVGRAWKHGENHVDPPLRWKRRNDEEIEKPTLRTNSNTRSGEVEHRHRPNGSVYPLDERPAPTVDSSSANWEIGDGEPEADEPKRRMRMGNQAKATERDEDEPAPTLLFGHRSNAVEWTHQRPATTVAGDPRIAQPGHKKDEDNPDSPGRMEGAVRVTVEEAAALQSFPPDYPWAGTKSKVFQQIGNAVPPGMAGPIIASLVGEA